MTEWKSRAETAQNELVNNFWNASLNIMNQCAPCDETCNDTLIYWWHAHVIDVLLDGYLRSGKSAYLERIALVVEGVKALNGGTLLHNWYDDMEWMALALLRVYDATKSDYYKEQVLTLWDDIKTAWNGHMGGGMAWKKDQPYYKNTPANGPASILASRLYTRFGKAEDLEQAKKIFYWLKANLVDTAAGFVWDGINRTGDGKIDYDWEYTYNQGVYIGAAVELFHITNDKAYLDDAVLTAVTSMKHFTDPVTGIIPNEGEDDCGLFKGIYVRYLRELYLLRPDLTSIRDMLLCNAESLWQEGRDQRGLISRSWQKGTEPQVQLCAQLSGIMLLEMTALL